MEETDVRRILDIALRFGQLLLGSQAGTADVAASILAVAAMCLVQSRSLDYTRLQLTTDLAQRVVDTTPDPEAVQHELDTLARAEHPYPRWVATAG